MLCFAVLYCTVLYCTVLYCTVLCCVCRRELELKEKALSTLKAALSQKFRQAKEDEDYLPEGLVASVLCSLCCR